MKSFIPTAIALLLIVVIGVTWAVSAFEAPPTPTQTEQIDISGTQYVHEKALDGNDRLYFGEALVCEDEAYSNFAFYDGALYFNRYARTVFGSTRCDVVYIAREGEEPTVLLRDAVVYGTAGDSLLVVKTDCAAPPFPEDNALRCIWYFAGNLDDTEIAQYYDMGSRQMCASADISAYQSYNAEGVFLPDAQSVIPWESLMESEVAR